MKIRKRTWTSGGRRRQAWQLDYTDSNGKRRRNSFDTKAEAEAAQREVAADLHKGTSKPGASENTVGEIVDLYLDALQNGTRTRTNSAPRATTVESYQAQINNYVRPRLGSLRLSQLDVQELARFRDWLVRDSNAGQRSRELALGQLKAALDEAEARGMVSGGWWRSIGISRSSSKIDDDMLEAIPSDTEMRRIIELARSMQSIYSPAIELDAMTGLRISEILALQVRDARLDTRELRVRRSVDRKGRVHQPKSSAGKRTVPLPDAACELLKAFVTTRDQEAFVFATGNGTPLGYYNLYNRGWRRLLQQAGLPSYRLHSLRHYYASCLIAAGADALEVKEILGHADVATTYNIYGHLLRADEGKRRDRVESVVARFERHKDGTRTC